MARDVSPAVLSILVDKGIEGAVVEWIEGKVEPLAGPAFMPTHDWTRKTNAVRHPFTAVHAMPVTNADREDDDATGTVSIFFHEGGDSDRVLGASCKHVLHSDVKSDYNIGRSALKQQVRVNGARKFQSVFQTIKDEVDRNVGAVVDVVEAIKTPRRSRTKPSLARVRERLSTLTQVLGGLRAFFKTVVSDWADAEARNIGYVD